MSQEKLVQKDPLMQLPIVLPIESHSTEVAVATIPTNTESRH